MNIKVERLMGLNLIKNRCLIRRERAFPWFKMINYTKAPGKGCSTFINNFPQSGPALQGCTVNVPYL